MNMEAAAKEQTASASSSAVAGKASMLRYPLRSATKREKVNPSTPVPSKSSASKHNSVSKSTGALSVSGKASVGKPPRRRLSVPNKPVGNTPDSEVRAERSATSSDRSKLSGRRKFNLLSSPSYWLSQIKHAETHAMHSVSLGFFSLALDAGCEDIRRIGDELKSYTNRHSLVEHGERVKYLFNKYNISESFEQPQVSETCSHVPNDANRSSDDDVHSSSPIGGNRELKLKSLNAKVQASSVMGQGKNETPKNTPANRTRSSSARNSVNSKARNSVNSKAVSDTKGHPAQKKTQESIKNGSNKETDKANENQGNNSHDESPNDILATKEGQQQDKENVDAAQIEETGVKEE